MADSERRIRDYPAFWRYYLREHAQPRTRSLHIAGTALALAAIFAFALTGQAWLLLAALLGGYGPAWFAHFVVEKKRPATFRYPFWSLISDFRMAWFWVTGRLNEELRRAGVNPD